MIDRKYVIWNAETDAISDYPREDDEPVVGLVSPPLYPLQVMREEPPEYDPETQRLEPTQTVDEAGNRWVLGWQLVELPPVVPVPQWGQFKRLLLGNPAVNQLIGGGLAGAPAAAVSLPATLLAAAQGHDVADFRATWLALRSQGLVSAELLAGIRAMAIECHLPAEFIAALGGAARPAAEAVGQEWVDAAGALWRVVQGQGESLTWEVVS